MMRKFFIAIFFIFLFVLPVAAAESEPSKDLFRFDDVVEISAPVTGDLYVAGRTVVLRGPVAGDVLVVGGTVSVTGAVEGNIRIIGNVVDLWSTVGGNVSVAARSFTLHDTVRIQKNLSFLGQAVDIASTVKGSVRLAALAPEEVNIRKSAVLDGVVTLYASEAPIVDAGALLRSPIIRHDALWSGLTTGDIIMSRVISFFGLLLIGLVIIHLLPRPSLVIASFMHTKPWQQLSWGLLGVFLPPLGALLLAFTVIGLPLAMIVGALWFMIVYSARIFAGLTIGFLLLSYVDPKRRMKSLVFVLLLGLLILAVLESLPFLGPIMTMLATIWALGAIITLLRTLFIEQKKLSL